MSCSCRKCDCENKKPKLDYESLRAEVRASRPITLPGSILKLFSFIPPLRMEFLRVMVSRKDLTFAEQLYLAAENAAGELHPAVNWIFRALKKYVPEKWMNAAMDFTVYGILADYFLMKSEKSYKKMREQCDRENTSIILDVVGEDAKTPDHAKNFLDSYEYIMKTFGGKVSVKLSSLIASDEWTGEYDSDFRLICARLRKVFTLAKKYRVPVTVDAEEYFKWCMITEDAFLSVIQEPKFREMENVGIALQVYRKDAYASAKKFLNVADARACPFRVRIVKGAYWDTENVLAAERNVASPLFQEKSQSDDEFDKIAGLFLKHRDLIRISPASHNIKNIWRTISAASGDYSDIEFEVLVGMGEPIRRVLSKNGIPVAVYLPMIRQGGHVSEGMQYLFRRITENTEGNSCLLKDPE